MSVATFLLILVFSSGFLLKLPRKSFFAIPKAVLLTGIETGIAMLLFIGIFWLLSYSNIVFMLLSGIGSLFLVVLLIAVINGFLLYWVQCMLFPLLKITMQILTLTEYMIQWSLIYITVYQVLYDNIFPDQAVAMLENFSLSSPSEIMIGILPSLISVWIAIIFYKLKTEQI